MIAPPRGLSVFASLFWVMVAFTSLAQPTLPDLTGNDENGMALLSWKCQYDGVKSISVLRSPDSNFNYSTIGYVKNLYKGVQAFVDGHPLPGKNFYKLFIVFNSGLTWRSNHYGVYIDSASIDPKRIIPSNEALQKLIVNEELEKKPKTEVTKTTKAEKPKQPKAEEPADKNKITEVLKKGIDDINDTTIKRPKFKFNTEAETDLTYIPDPVPADTKHKIVISSIDNEEINAADYFDEKKPGSDTRKKISITFDDDEDVTAFIETIPKSPGRKITISYTEEDSEQESETTIEEQTEQQKRATQLSKIEVQQPKKITATFKTEEAAQAYVESLSKITHNKITVSYNADSADIKHKLTTPVSPTPSTTVIPEPVKPKITIKFSDDVNANPSSEIKSKYIAVDPLSGHIKINLPGDLATHTYSLKFFDKDNRAVIEVPKLNTQAIIMDKRNFQKKGQYKFTIRKDAIELESGYITIY